MDKQSWMNLTGYASKFGLSGSSVLLSAYIDMIAFWSATKKFSIGIINTYRPPMHPNIERILGNFNTMQIISADVLSGSFIERTEKLQQQVLYNIEHPYFSGPEVLREFNRMKIRSSKTTLPVFFNSVISHSNNESAPKSNGNSEANNTKKTFGKTVIKVFQRVIKYLGISLEMRPTEINIYPSLMQLIPTIYEEGDGTIYCKWQGAKKLFPNGVLKEMAENYQKLIKKLSEKEESWYENWGESISELLRNDEYTTSTKDQGQDLDESLNTILLRQVDKYEGQIAIITSERTITYRELYFNSSRITKLLEKNGITKNSLVVLMMDKNFMQIAAVLGILQAGAAYIPVGTDISNDELEHILQINNRPVVITQSWIGERLEWSDSIKRIYLEKEELSDLYEKPVNSQQKPNDLACIIYNSDCIDNSKCLRINHSMIKNAVLYINERFDVNSADKILSLYPSVSEQWLYDIFGMLTVGGTIILPEEQKEKDVYIGLS
jgi:non-ribosomal peptide synthetase component F